MTDDSPAIPSQDEAIPKATQHSEQTPAFKMEQARSSRTFCCLDPPGNRVAEISGPLLSFGRQKLSFPNESSHSSHNIDLRPVGAGSREGIFVQGSVPYFWERVQRKRLPKL